LAALPTAPKAAEIFMRLGSPGLANAQAIREVYRKKAFFNPKGTAIRTEP